MAKLVSVGCGFADAGVSSQAVLCPSAHHPCRCQVHHLSALFSNYRRKPSCSVSLSGERTLSACTEPCTSNDDLTFLAMEQSTMAGRQSFMCRHAC